MICKVDAGKSYNTDYSYEKMEKANGTNAVKIIVIQRVKYKTLLCLHKRIPVIGWRIKIFFYSPW
jgi:hypothetical protein